MVSESSYAELKQRLAKIHDLNAIEGLIGWDQQTIMPAKAAEVRAAQIATITGLSHEMFTADETGRLLEAAQKHTDALDPDSDEASLVRVVKHDWERARRVPNE